MFELLKTDPSTKARLGKLTTAHGVVDTPVFMSVGTQASVKALDPRELHEMGTQIILGNTYHLKAAAVGENRLFPIHELVQSTSGADDVESGADVEMVGVAEDDLRAHLVEFARVNRLHAALRADGHEDRKSVV